MTIERQFKVVELRDGTKITVREAAYDETARLVEYEQAALAIVNKTRAGQEKLSAQDFRYDYFMVKVYPKLQGCSSTENGYNIPTLDEAYSMPTSELNKWYSAARELNPDWFAEFDQAVEQMQEEEKKKNNRERANLRAPGKAAKRQRR